MMPNPRVTRPTSRVLLFDEHDRVLLFHSVAPDTSRVARWITPGGGVEPGETHRAGALRELYEETGLVAREIEGPVLRQDFAVEWDDADHDRGHAEFFVVRTVRFEPSAENWTADERVDTLAHRWWSVDDLEHTDERLEPVDLPAIVRARLRRTSDAPAPEEEEP
ncbi:MAG: NUDIX domain-containing protein [Micrococcales bacterium]|nr:NUDIX domain-containing protein [Micrococcales bacterium]